MLPKPGLSGRCVPTAQSHNSHGTASTTTLEQPSPDDENAVPPFAVLHHQPLLSGPFWDSGSAPRRFGTQHVAWCSKQASWHMTPLAKPCFPPPANAPTAAHAARFRLRYAVRPMNGNPATQHGMTHHTMPCRGIGAKKSLYHVSTLNYTHY